MELQYKNIVYRGFSETSGHLIEFPQEKGKAATHKTVKIREQDLAEIAGLVGKKIALFGFPKTPTTEDIENCVFALVHETEPDPADLDKINIAALEDLAYAASAAAGKAEQTAIKTSDAAMKAHDTLREAQDAALELAAEKRHDNEQEK